MRGTTIHDDYQWSIFLGLQRKPIYQGTVPAAERRRRRAANRRARAARRVNRGR